MTYPAYSNKYTELVCTGAIDEETKRLVRIHPLPKRYLDEENDFRTFQRARVRWQHNRHDPRPESMRVDFRTVEPLDVIAAKEQTRRRSYVETSPSMAASVEELQDLNRRFKTSLGIVVPKEIVDVKVRRRTEEERQEWLATESTFLSQKTLEFVRPPKRIAFPEAEFIVWFRCNDSRCTEPHRMSLKSWPIHEGYRKMVEKGDPDRDGKALAQMEAEFDLAKRDVFLFLGTFHNHQTTFGLMDAYRPKKMKAEAQMDLFK
ncbi:MAG: hypothetical protein KIT84_35845 [Labilithrix sp.]|nr:hypothetical protein [Labilithrix sp.]MCW5816427.1 hypothetical protein [Labilithrix sp.]